MFYVKKLGEIAVVLGMLSLTGASAVAESPPDPFDYTLPQVIYVEEESFYQQYANLGPLAELAMERDYQLARIEARTAQIIEEREAIKIQEWADADQFERYQIEADKAIAALWPWVNVTPYGFGDEPLMWDCSGLTKWYLEYRGFTDIVHSATSQVNDYRSTIVDEPVPGDLVAFQKYAATASYFHIGVYVGGGYMIHSSNPIKDTNFQTVESFAESENSRVVYLRW